MRKSALVSSAGGTEHQRGHSGTCLSHTTALHDVRSMEQTIEKYPFMLGMQSVDLPNSLFGKACRECCKRGPVQEVRHAQGPPKYAVLITGIMRMTSGNITKRLVCHHYDCEEEYQEFHQLITWLSGRRGGSE